MNAAAESIVRDWVEGGGLFRWEDDPDDPEYEVASGAVDWEWPGYGRNVWYVVGGQRRSKRLPAHIRDQLRALGVPQV